ncbi:protein CEBPZOS isoform X1 [Struthio camelus]|uniref:protein CEBPZOS isoform X1 n=1 Tax=Struthio camelus TaxID=8801 RepID=UPI0036042BC1
MRTPPARKRRAPRGRTARGQPLAAVTAALSDCGGGAAMARRAVAGLLLLEAAGLVGAMLLYRRMDRSQDFRYTMQKRFPSILEGRLVAVDLRRTAKASVASYVQKRFYHCNLSCVYYKSNEWSGIHGIRENDQIAWLSSKN